MKAATLRELPSEELAKNLQDCLEELYNLRFQKASDQIENTGRIRTLRRDIARIKTVQNERRNS